MRLFHGTDPESAAALQAGAELDLAAAAARHTNGAPGFCLASDRGDAKFFAVRLGAGRVIEYEISEDAVHALLDEGAVYRPIPRGTASPFFSGSELFVPPEIFTLFNALVKRGEVSVHSGQE